jgi:hypothetical protein
MEFFVAFLLSYLFYSREKPKLKFILYGYLFFLLALFLQFPFRLLQYYLLPYLSNYFLPLIIPILTIIISELTKYFSLKRFMKTKSYKNGIFFGIGWVSLESISIISSTFYFLLFSAFAIQISSSGYFGPNLSFFNFVYFFTVNLAITVLVIVSLIKKNYYFLIYAILFSILIFLGFELLGTFELLFFALITFFIAFILIFKYRLMR